MFKKRKSKIEFVDSRVERDEIKGLSIKGVIDGSLIAGTSVVKQLPFILFLAFLAIVYITNRYHAEKMVREIVSLREEVKNLRAEQITTTSELMIISMPSKVQELIDEKGLDLQHPTEPAYKIEVKK